MPGVVVTTKVRVGPTGTGEVLAAQCFMAGTAERGSIVAPTLLRSMAEYQAFFGVYETGNLWSYVKTFFEEGGQRCYAVRVLKTGSTTGKLVLKDRAGVPVNTLQIDAANPGDWDVTLSIEVQDGDSANTFKILVRLNGTLEYTSRDLTNPADAVAVLNTSSVNHLLVASDLSSVTAAPNNNPAVLVSTPLAGGGDSTAPLEADYTAALSLFGYSLGMGAVAIPGQSGAGTYAALMTHAQTNNRIALCAFGATDSVSAVKTAVASYYANAAAEYAGFYYPWIKIPSPATTGLEITQSPEAYVAGARAKAITQTGPWRAGADLLSDAMFVSDIVTDINQATGDGLDAKRINAIRKIANGIRIYGARSVDSDEENWRYITLRDTVNLVVANAEERLEDFVFSPIDSRGALFARIEAALIAMLDPIRLSGGLYEAYDIDGNLIDPGYSVNVSDDLNPAAQLALGTVAAEIGVRVSSVGDQIKITVTKSNLTASVV